MYQQHFGLSAAPFSLSPDTRFFHALPAYQSALNVLLVALRSGEGFVKISGEVGVGKTILCRMLLESLDDFFVTVYIPNPVLDAEGLRMAMAEELGTELPPQCTQHYVLKLITEALKKHHAAGRKVVLVVDEAQALNADSLESLRLLTNLETESTKLLQVVLFGQPELDELLAKTELRQLRQRITFSYKLPSLTYDELSSYVHHRLQVAGRNEGQADNAAVFSSSALKLLHRASRAVPRLVNILCHKAMLAAYGEGSDVVSQRHMLSAVNDTEDARLVRSLPSVSILMVVGLAIANVIVGLWVLLNQ